MNIPYVFKKCTKCSEWLVACKGNFHKAKTGKYGLKSECKYCKKEYMKQYRKDNKDKISEYYKQYYESNKEQIAEQRNQYYEKNKDKILEYQKQYYEENRDKELERHKLWCEDNKDKISEQRKQYYVENKEYFKVQSKQYRESNKEQIAERHKLWCEDNKDKISEYMKQYYATPQGQVVAFNSKCRRRLRKQNQGNGINKDQWLEMMNYFNWECAYSGITLTKENRSIDHIEPINKGGEHEIWNVVPMDKGLNSSKNDKDMLQWYKEQTFFSEERLNKIYEWQEYAYKKWHDKEEII